MSAFVFRIEDVFQISGRGCVIAPGVPDDSTIVLRVGDPLLLKLPDGSETRTQVHGIEMVSYSPDALKTLGMPPASILVGPELAKHDLPVGTEVWVPSAG